MAASLPAAVIRGTIVENRTGKPLARASVAVQPIAPTPGKLETVRTDRFGGFEFQSLAPGAYVLKATLRGFLPLEYGQKLWNSAGQPIIISNDSTPFLNLRMLRYAGITGMILDENDIGLFEHEVVAYRTTQPPQLVMTRATTDDRGVYRISGLEPGVYVVRTTGARDEQITYVPTFGKETQEFPNARIVQVYPDEDATGMDIRPFPGRLLTLSVSIDIDTDGCPGDLLVTLASQMGRQTQTGRCLLQFDSLPPGDYEIYAESPSAVKGGYTPVSLNRDMGVALVARDIGSTGFQTTPSSTTTSMQVMGRRKDLAGVGPAVMLKLANNSATLAPGRWEVMLIPPAGNYVSSFFASGYRPLIRADGWNEIRAPERSARFVLSGGPGEIHGTVKSSNDAVLGAPVYLEAWDPQNHKRLLDLRAVRTDAQGSYRFQGLAPGIYRILATFEFNMPDSASMDLAAPQTVRVEAHTDQQLDLDLYGIR